MAEEEITDLNALRNELREAIWEGELERVREIVESKPELVNAPTEDYGQTALIDAVGSAERTPELVEYLLKKGADPTARTREGYTALHCAVDVDGETCHGEMPGQIIRMLIDAGADLEAKQHWGWTPLMRAIVEGVADEVQALCDAGARVDHVFPEHTLPECKRGDTMLMAAVYEPQKVKILMAAGADPYQGGLYGQNALEHAQEQLREVSQPDHKREMEEWGAQLLKDQEAYLRSLGTPDEFIVESLMQSRAAVVDSESEPKESLRAMGRAAG